MNFDEYQTETGKTAQVFVNQKEEATNWVMGLCGEAGEVSEVFKKHLFHGHVLDREKLVKELGDVLWYVARLAACYQIGLSEVAERNIAKLRARYGTSGFSNAKSINKDESKE